MSYINLVAYVKWEINNILHEVWAWAQAYVDDIACGAKSLPNLLNKLWVLFEILLLYNISIKSTKLFHTYPDMGLLGQKVNFLRLTTSDKKLKAIRFLTYPNTLRGLEYYLGLTGNLQSYIHFYMQLVVPLQELKTLLLYHTTVTSQQRTAYASKTKLGPPTP